MLTVISYRDEAEAVAIANDSEYGLSAGVWGSPERAKAVADQLEAGTVWINDWHAGFPMTPFGGYKQSGVGRELGPDALAEYTQVKTIHETKTSDGPRAASRSSCRRPPPEVSPDPRPPGAGSR